MSSGLTTDEAGPAASLRLALLGGFVMSDAGGEMLSLPTAKTRLLMAYLALSPGQPQPRARLCALLWEDRAEDQARASLRNALSAIRAVVGNVLIADRDTVTLDANLLQTDVAELEQAVLQGGAVDPERARRFAAPLLDGLGVSGELAAGWLDFERTRCRNLAEGLMEASAERLSAGGDEAGAITLAKLLVSLDPYREKSHRLLMRLYADNGERSLALAQFQKCRQLLRDELGTAPSPQTIALARELGSEVEPRPAEAAPPQAPKIEALPAAGDQVDFRISIAVLPFSHPADDDDQHFLAEGIAEDLITELSRHKDFLVIARQSSFEIGAGPGRAQAAAEALNVRYVLTGNLRRRGPEISIGVQLVDTAASRNAWAERYTRPLDEIFALQDEIVGRIIAEVDAEVRLSERERAARKQPQNMDAWELFHRGLWHVYHFSAEEIERAEEFFRRAAEASPGFALPEAGLAYAALVRVIWNLTDNIPATLSSAFVYARHAVALDGTNPFSQVVLARLLTYKGDVALAFDHLRIALELNPSYAHAYYALAQAHFWAGQPGEALPNIERALALSPRDPLTGMFLTVRAFCLLLLDDIEAAEASARAAIAKQAREPWSRLALAVALVESGRLEEARERVAEAKALVPQLTFAKVEAFTGGVVPKDRFWAAFKAARLD